MKLTEKQKRFVDYYIETGNQTEAARRAGYKQPQTQGAQTLGKLSVKAAIDARLKELEDKRIAKADEVMQFLTSTLRGDAKEQKLRLQKLEAEIRAAEKVDDDAVTIVDDLGDGDDEDDTAQ